jgi:broad specificity phosphatase PhoE
MTTRFMLARHATCALTEHMLFGRVIDAPLDTRGQRQALALARRIAPEKPSAVLSSPRRRARQTARAIAALTGHTVRVDWRLDELDFGRWSGKSFASLAADPDWHRWNRERASSATPLGDDMAKARMRLMQVLDDIAQEYPEQTVVLVTHAEVIRAALLHFMNRSANDFQKLEIAPASLSVVNVAPDGGVRIEIVNERPPLTATPPRAGGERMSA